MEGFDEHDWVDALLVMIPFIAVIGAGFIILFTTLEG